MMDLVPSETLFGQEIHRRFDQYGPIQVFDDGNKRYLSFGTTDEQSCQLKVSPFQLQHDYLRAMLTVLVQFDHPISIRCATVLGLGGGSLTAALWQQLSDAQIHAIELRPAVAQIAHQYFALPRDRRLTIHIACASDYLKQANHSGKKSDLIFSDLYLADGLNPTQQQQSFIQQCDNHLSDNGWLVLNLWKEHREDTGLLSSLKTLFPTLLHATTHDGNWIVWASHCQALNKKMARQQCKQLQPGLADNRWGFNLWGVCKQFYRYR